MKYIALRDELVNDPATLGYTGDDAGDLILLTTENITVDRATMSASEIFEAIDDTEWQGRSADQKADIRFVLTLGDSIQIAQGSKARAMLLRALTGANTTRGALASIAQRTISRAAQLDLGTVHLGDIQNARVA